MATYGRFEQRDEKEHAALNQVFTHDTARDLILALSRRDDDAAIELVDGAYWKKGCSSLGTLRFAALVRISGKKLGDQITLIDLKEAVESVAPTAVSTDGAGTAGGPAMPADHAVRVVTGARALSPNLGDRMAATHILGKPMVIRELMPQDLKLEIDQFSRAEAPKAARYLAYVVGLAHARRLDASARKAWRAELQRRHSTTLDAPSWPWSSMIDLVARHEEGYLDTAGGMRRIGERDERVTRAKPFDDLA